METPINPDELLLPATERTYYLRVKVVLVREYVEDLGKRFERELVLLVPQESDQRISFLMAWLPEVETEHAEVVGYLKYPVDSPVRLAVMRKNRRYPTAHHLFVMSKGVEDILIAECGGRTLDLIVFPEKHDSVADASRESSTGNFKKI